MARTKLTRKQYFMLRKSNQNGWLPPVEYTCREAALHGVLETFHDAKARGAHWDELTCAYAASNGHLHILKWASENGCPWDELTCALAAAAGHVRILAYAHANGCP